MARKGIAPLSTTIALASTSGSSTTNQRPTPKKITRARTKPPPTMAGRTRHVREWGLESIAGLPAFDIREPAHAIPRRRSGQSAALGHRITISVAHDPRLGPQPFPLQDKRPRRSRWVTARLAGWDGGGRGL